MAETHHDHTGAILIVYDGACAFCQRSIAAIRQRDRQGQFVYLPRQTPGLEERYPQLAVGDFETGMRLIEPDGTMHIGADAIHQIASRLPSLRWAAWMYHVPIVHAVTRRIYSWVAANRMKLSRHCGETCVIGTDDGHAESLHRVRAYTKTPQFLISTVILLVLGLHIVADLAKTVNSSSWIGSQSWPFLAYGMYRKSYGPRIIRTTKHHIIGVTTGGEELEIVPNIVGLRAQALHQHFVKPMLKGNSSAARRLAGRINVDRRDPVIAFRVESEAYAIAESGIVKEDKQSMTYPVGD